MNLSQNPIFLWFTTQPRLAKLILLPTFFIPILIKFGFLYRSTLVFTWYALIKRYHFWKLFTCYFVAPLNFNLLVDAFLRYQALSQLELFALGESDTLIFLLFGFICAPWLCLFDKTIRILTPVMSSCIVYVWAMFFPDQQFRMFFISFKAVYAPWVLLAINVIIFDNYFLPEFTGIIIGNLYLALHKWSPFTKSLLSSNFYLLAFSKLQKRISQFFTGKRLGKSALLSQQEELNKITPSEVASKRLKFYQELKTGTTL